MASKESLRQLFLTRRNQLDGRQRLAASEAIESLFLKNIKIEGRKVIAGYWPVRGEIDVLPLLNALRTQRHRTALPSVEVTDGPLLFRRWSSKTPMRMTALKIMEPEPGVSEPVLPDIVIVPLVAYDTKGYRLGYGKGMYDRTLRHIRQIKPILSVGVAFSLQACEDLPHEPHDERLDWIINEKEALCFEGIKA